MLIKRHRQQDLDQECSWSGVYFSKSERETTCTCIVLHILSTSRVRSQWSSVQLWLQAIRVQSSSVVPFSHSASPPIWRLPLTNADELNTYEYYSWLFTACKHPCTIPTCTIPIVNCTYGHQPPTILYHMQSLNFRSVVIPDEKSVSK